MYLDLSRLQGTLGDGSKPPHRFENSAVFSVKTVVERSKRVAARAIDTAPFRVLDAPGLIDDYYLNLLDWSGPAVHIALGESVYGYNVETKETAEVFTGTAADYIASLCGTSNGLAVGESNGKVSLVDPEKGPREILTTNGPRVCSLAANGRLISAGDHSGRITNYDVRCGVASVLNGHSQEVCGLKWTNDYLASGSNDNTVRVWRSGSPVSQTLRGHSAAVKALDWCPWKSNILVTGGGTKDKSIRFWDAVQGTCLRVVQTDSQICSLLYLGRYKELISSHGFTENDIRLWRVSQMRMMSSFGSHTSRILHCVLSPDQCTVASLGADESLRFWKVAEKPSKTFKRDSIGVR